MEKNLPTSCPSCSSVLTIRRLGCGCCQTSIEGIFNLPVLVRLSVEDQKLILELVKASGSLKDLAAHYGISYPTMRNRIDDLIERIRTLEVKIQEENLP